MPYAAIDSYDRASNRGGDSLAGPRLSDVGLYHTYMVYNDIYCEHLARSLATPPVPNARV